MPVVVISQEELKLKLTSSRSNSDPHAGLQWKPYRERRVYAGRCKDMANRRTSPGNPWTAYKLPSDWQPKHVPEKIRMPDFWEPSSALEEGECDAAIASLNRGRKLGITDEVFLGERRRRAVVLDTESVTSKLPGAMKGENVLASLSVVDFLTGEVLIDVAVLPDKPVTNWIAWINGITPDFFHAARRYGNVVQGAEGAKELLSQYVGSETLIIGHALSNDVAALSLRHRLFADTQFLYSLWGHGGRSVGLRNACLESLDIDPQSGSHSALEDTMATRELALKLCNVGKYWEPPPPSPERDWMDELNDEPDNVCTGSLDIGTRTCSHPASNEPLASEKTMEICKLIEFCEPPLPLESPVDESGLEEEGWTGVKAKKRSRKRWLPATSEPRMSPSIKEVGTSLNDGSTGGANQASLTNSFALLSMSAEM